MSRRARAASGEPRSRWPTSVISAFHSAQPRPRDHVSGVDAQLGPEPVAARARQERPGDHRVARGIADAGRAEVEHGREPPVADQQVPGRDVAVEPDRLAVPLGGHRVVPDALDVVGRDLAAERVDRLERLALVSRQRAAAEPVVPSRPGPAGRVDAAQRDQEPRQRRREPVQVVDARLRRDLTLEPAVHRPRVREPAAGLAQRDRSRDRQRQPRREHGQPALLLRDLPGVPVAAGQPDAELRPEPERPVVPAVELDRRDRQLRPLRELAVDQPPRQGRVDHGRFAHADQSAT